MFSIMQLTALAALTTAAIGIGGCVAVTSVEVPAIQGRVVDAQGQPLPNAVIRVVRNSDQREVAAISPQPDGTFSRAEQSTWTLQPADADRKPAQFSITATAGNQHSPTTPVCDDPRLWYVWFAWENHEPTPKNLGDLQVP